MKNRASYAPDWLDTIRPAILKRDNYKCKHCRVEHRTPYYKDEKGITHQCDKWLAQWAQSNGYHVRVLFLQVAHLDQDPTNNSPANLLTLCPACHFRFDNKHNKLKRLASRAIRRLLPIGSSYRPELKPPFTLKPPTNE